MTLTLRQAADLAACSLVKMRRIIRAGYLTAYEQEPVRGGWVYRYRKADVLQAVTWWEKDHPRGRPWPKKAADTPGAA